MALIVTAMGLYRVYAYQLQSESTGFDELLVSGEHALDALDDYLASQASGDEQQKSASS